MGYKETLLTTLKEMQSDVKRTRELLDSINSDVKLIPAVKQCLNENTLISACLNAAGLANSIELMIRDLERDKND